MPSPARKNDAELVDHERRHARHLLASAVAEQCFQPVAVNELTGLVEQNGQWRRAGDEAGVEVLRAIELALLAQYGDTIVEA